MPDPAGAKVYHRVVVPLFGSGYAGLGRAAILEQSPHERPEKTKRSPAPAFHAATKAARRALREAYGWFLAAYRDAAEKLRKGEQGWKFPEGAFPPALPFARGDLAQESCHAKSIHSVEAA